jgi:hypothetical protein
MLRASLKGFVGETVRIRALNQFEIIVSDNTDTVRQSSHRRALVRTSDGIENDYWFSELDLFLPDADTLKLRLAMRRKFPALYIV